MLTAERLRELLDYDQETGCFTWRKPSGIGSKIKADDLAGSVDRDDGYIRITVDNRAYKAHRLAWMHVHGTLPRVFIDHRNGVPSDNRLANLRLATPSQNSINRKCVNKYSFKGIKFKRGFFEARIGPQAKTHLGTFRTPEEAARAYDEAAVRMYGDRARLNFPK